jgi:hypothetical protein
VTVWELVKAEGESSLTTMNHRSVSRLLGYGQNYPQLIERIRSHPELWMKYQHVSFAFEVDAVNYKMRKSRVS